MDKFHDDCFIVISQYGIQRMTKRPGKMARGEIAVKVRLVVPTSIFQDPAPSAIIHVPESFAIHPAIEVDAVRPTTFDAPEQTCDSSADTEQKTAANP